MAGGGWFAVDTARSAITAAASPLSRASAAVSPQILCWAVAAAGGFVLFAEVLSAGAVLREDHDLTI